MHTIELDQMVLEAEDGLMLGNGDLSVSIYQKAGQIVWRFGKNDVWDRRLDTSDSPEPAHIDEVARGVRDEGWTSHGFLEGHGEATRGTTDEKRMKDLCSGYPAYASRPYPCPKPVGELALHFPVDQRGLKISQRLSIEKATVDIRCEWESSVVINVHCFVAPSPNALVVSWEAENWSDETATGEKPPVWFSLYRWADPTVEKFASELFSGTRYGYFQGSIRSDKVTPLPPPSVRQIDGHPVVEQKFYPDLEFSDGFRYGLAPFASDLTTKSIPATMDNGDAARIHLISEEAVLKGEIAVVVPCSTDKGGMEAELRRLRQQLAADLPGTLHQWETTALADAEQFWAKSAVEIDDPLLESTWYGTLHTRRCAYRAGVIAPGLAFPSTVQDYSLWHGDYHTNFNYQQPFYGDYTANHIDVGDSFFPGMKHMVDIGRKLARDYWGCRGTFIQLSGYPFPTDNDPYGTGPLARMAYMTGWVSNHYWWRYLYTQDLEWLRSEGYPIIRATALFYTDFLKKGDDGLYHAFPSGQGEYFYTGKPEDYTDQPQVVRHARYCLQSAVQAADALGADETLRQQWQEILDHLVQVDDLDKLGMSDEEKRRYYLNMPAFIGMDVGNYIPRPGDEPKYLHLSRGGSNFLPWQMMIHLRNGVFEPDRDVPAVRAHLRRWYLPNGVIRAMSTGDHGFIGAYGESTGILEPLQEMMLQSWDGVIRVFPAWPKQLNAQFKTLRAEGAFLVSAAWQDGRVRSLSIISEAGKRCSVASPWPDGVSVIDEAKQPVKTTAKDRDTIAFETAPGKKYKLVPTRTA